MRSARGSVVVAGVDGSPASVAALVHAFGEAAVRRGLVEVVTAWSWPPSTVADTDLGLEHEGRRVALSIQATAVDRARRLYGRPIRITAVIVEGDPAAVLADAGRGAACIVLGKRAYPAPDSARDSVLERCLTLATCPVVVVPERLDLDRELRRMTDERPVPRRHVPLQRS